VRLCSFLKISISWLVPFVHARGNLLSCVSLARHAATAMDTYHHQTKTSMQAQMPLSTATGMIQAALLPILSVDSQLLYAAMLNVFARP
jgi:hypothetical protein